MPAGAGAGRQVLAPAPAEARGVTAFLLGIQLAEAEALYAEAPDAPHLRLLTRTIAYRARTLGAAPAAAATRLTGGPKERGPSAGELAEAAGAIAASLLLEDLRLAAAHDAGRGLVAEALTARRDGAGALWRARPTRERTDAAIALAAPVLPAGAAHAVLGSRRSLFSDPTAPGATPAGTGLARVAAAWHAVLAGRLSPGNLGPSLLAPVPAPAPAPAEPIGRRGVLGRLGARVASLHWRAWVMTLVAAIAAVLVLHDYVVQTFAVPSGSMSPTIRAGDRVGVDVFPLGRGPLRRGNVVVFRRPPADSSAGSTYLVKRIIGLPGDTVASRGTTVLINGRPLREPWLPALTGRCATIDLQITPVRVPPGDYFVMGDCRGDSVDSRAYGDIAGTDVVGKVDFVYWRGGHPVFSWL